MRKKNSRRHMYLTSILQLLGITLFLFAVVGGIVAVTRNYIKLSIKGGDSEDTAVVVEAQQDISITLLTQRDTNEYYFWDNDEEKQVFSFASPFSLKATTTVPDSIGIHKLVVVRDSYFLKTTNIFYYKVE